MTKSQLAVIGVIVLIAIILYMLKATIESIKTPNTQETEYLK